MHAHLEQNPTAQKQKHISTRAHRVERLQRLVAVLLRRRRLQRAVRNAATQQFGADGFERGVELRKDERLGGAAVALLLRVKNAINTR